ncbi:HepT-like ribonuclease domain-containing protein [Parafrankia elaeagni]|uniref:HepT-like ribonuclease domain-containing protein n=1 Tax=Parafrankia elaeagni TaxID=222534 RepID=UPI00036E6B4B|nr:HepT-like ribonuclease domain-containing protein [Parafrankia elaeagni]
MRSDDERLRDIVEHAELISAHLPTSHAELDQNVVLSAALIRWVGIIGEAAARLSDSFHAEHPEVPWGAITGMRNHLVHGYFSVDTNLLWTAVTVEIPGLSITVKSWLNG